MQFVTCNQQPKCCWQAISTTLWKKINAFIYSEMCVHVGMWTCMWRSGGNLLEGSVFSFLLMVPGEGTQLLRLGGMYFYPSSYSGKSHPWQEVWMINMETPHSALTHGGLRCSGGQTSCWQMLSALPFNLCLCSPVSQGSEGVGSGGESDNRGSTHRIKSHLFVLLSQPHQVVYVPVIRIFVHSQYKWFQAIFFKKN